MSNSWYDLRGANKCAEREWTPIDHQASGWAGGRGSGSPEILDMMRCLFETLMPVDGRTFGENPGHAPAIWDGTVGSVNALVLKFEVFDHPGCIPGRKFRGTCPQVCLRFRVSTLCRRKSWRCRTYVYANETASSTTGFKIRERFVP